MKTLKRILFMSITLVAVVVLFVVLGTTSYATEIVDSGSCGSNGDNVKWSVDSEGVLKIFGEGSMINYSKYLHSSPWSIHNTIINEIIVDDFVTSIGSYSFHGLSSVSKITIGKSVASIGDGAFLGCVNLAELNCNAIRINDFSYKNSVFANCGIAGDGFDVVFDDATEVIPSYMFFANSFWADYDVNVKNVDLGNSIISIGSCAFKNCQNIKNIDLGNSITSIGNCAFENCENIKNISIPASIENIKDGAFYGCLSLAEISVHDDNMYYSAVDNVLYTKNKQVLILYPKAKSDTYYQILPETIRIDSYAFYGNMYLEKIKINENISAIENGAFENCISLRELEWNAKNIASENYGSDVFKNAGSIDKGFSVIIDNNTEKIPDYIFSESNLSSINIKADLIDIPAYAFYECGKLSDISIPETVEVIKNSSFYNCDALLKITLPKSLVCIEQYSFYDCNGLTEIEWSDNIQKICQYAFANCNSLEKIYFCDSISVIEMYAFRKCTALKILQLPNNDVAVGNWAFEDCSELIEIIFPENIKKIDLSVFSGSTSLKKLVFVAPSYEFVSVKVSNVSNFTVYAHPNGNVEEFAKEKAFPFEAVHAFASEMICTATCTEDGIEYQQCKYCEEKCNVEVVEAFGHTEEKLFGKPATCYSEGFAEGKKCSVCGEILEYQEIIPELLHTPGEWEVVVEAQVGIEGKEQQKCTVCGDVVDERTIPALPDVTYMIGDANGDGKITAADARIILRISAKLEKTEDYNLPFEVFDVTGDSKINAADARKALRISAKLE